MEGTVSRCVLTHQTLIALISRRSLESSHLYSFFYSALFSVQVALRFTSMEMR